MFLRSERNYCFLSFTAILDMDRRSHDGGMVRVCQAGTLFLLAGQRYKRLQLQNRGERVYQSNALTYSQALVQKSSCDLLS